MGYLIEISDSKIDKMSEYVEDMLWAGGELMHCLEKMKGESGYGEREPYGSRYGERSRGGYGSRYDEMGERGRYGSRGGSMGYRDDEEEWESMNERRGVRGSGRGRR
jgi:hypothetical protein